MIAANQWYNIAQTSSAGSKTSIRIELGSYYALIAVSIDYGNAVISAIESNAGDGKITISARIRYNNGWMTDIKITPGLPDAELKASLYDNTGWISVPANTSTSGSTVCIINDIASAVQIPQPCGESLFELKNFGTDDEPSYAVVPKRYNGIPVGIVSESYITFGEKKNEGDEEEDNTGQKLSLYSLHEIGVVPTSLKDGEVLTFDGASGLWINKLPSVGLDETKLGKYLTDKEYLTKPLADKLYTSLTVFEEYETTTNDRLDNLESIIGIDNNGNVYIKRKDDGTARGFYTYGPITFGGIGGNTEGGGSTGSTVSYSPSVTSGKLLGTLNIDGVDNRIYAPSIPTALPNPYSLTINGTSYDGSSDQSINITAESLGALTEDNAESTYATITALNGLQASHNALRNEFDSLNKVLNDDVSGKINTWNEVVNFLDEYSGSQDLATILSGMNGNITTLQGYFTGGKAKKAVEAERLSDTGTYKAWGQTFFENGVPKGVDGLMVSTGSSTDIGMRVKGSTYELLFGIGAGNINRGIYDYNNNQWWIYRDNTTDTLIPIGNVGIGVSPAYKLDVNGNIHTSAALVVGSTQVTEKSQNNTKYLEVDGNLVVKGSISFGGYGEGSTGSGGLTSVNVVLNGTTYASVGNTITITPRIATEDWVTGKLSSVSGFDESKMWTALGTNSTTKKISANYIGDLSGKYLLLDEVSKQRVAYAASAGDADTLDGVQYQNILERSYSRTAQFKDIGWYRIAKLRNVTGANCTLYLYQSYNNNNNCSFIFNFSCAYGTINITQVGGATNTRTIDKVRVSHNGSERYIDIHLAGTANYNHYYWTIVGAAEAIEAISNPTALANNTEFATAWTGFKTESLTIGSTLIEEKEQNNTKYIEIDGNLVVKGSISFGGVGTSGGTSGGLTSFQITIGNSVYASEGNNVTIPTSSLRSALSINNVTNLAARDYLTDLSSNATNAISLTVGGTTKYITATALKTSLGLGSLAYKSSLAASDIPSLDWSKITTGKPTTLAGYGITNALPNTTKYALGDAVGGNAVSANKLTTARNIWGNTFNGAADVAGSITIKDTAGFYHSSPTGASLCYIGHDWVNPYAHIYNMRSGCSLRVQDDGNICIPSGNVLIGTTDDNSRKLSVYGAGFFTAGATSLAGVLIGESGNTIDGVARTSNTTYANLYLNYTSKGNVILGYGGGNVGIGINSPTAKLHVSGNIVATGAITFGSASDRKLKDNIQAMTDKQAIAVLQALNPVTFTWNSTAYELGKLSGISDGFIADEYEKLIPNSGRDIWANYRAINYERATGYLVKGWQKHQSEIERLKDRVRELEKELKQYRRA